MPVYVAALRNLGKIRLALAGNPEGVADVDRVIAAVVREMSRRTPPA